MEGKEEAGGDAGEDGDVLGGDAGGGVVAGRDGGSAEEALDAARLVDADEGRVVEEELVVVVGVGGRRGKGRIHV